jgi:gliding motility-associated-like protein
MKNGLYTILLIMLNVVTISAQQTTITVSAGINGTTTNTCNGFIIDSGGQGGSGYSNNENTTFTICPDIPGDIINVVFNLFDLDGTDQNPAPNVENVDRMLVYDGTSTAATFLGEYNNNGLQGVVIQCTPQNLTGCLTFRFISNGVGVPGFFSGSATCSTPCADPTAGGIVLDGITLDSIHACIGEEINFEEIGSFAQNGFSITEYKWDFMDGTEEIGQDVTHSFAIPGHYRVQLFVTDDNGCTNNNLTDIDVLIATPPNFINFQQDTTLCIGESLNVIATPLLYENTWEGFTGETTINNGCMTDDQLGVAQNVDIVQTGFSSGTTITDISQIQSLCMDMEHSFMGDLVISIACPNGQNVILHQQGGGGTQIGEPIQEDNVDCTDPSTQGVPYQYCFTPTANTTWVEWANANGGTLPAGDYEPVQSLGGLVGCPTNGVWTLTVVDNWAADDGTVFSFALNLDPSMYPDVVEFTPEHGEDLDSSYWGFPAPFVTNLSADGDQMTVTPTQAGVYNYVYTVRNNFGCTNDTSFNLTVRDFVSPVSLVDTTICAGNLVTMINAAQYNCNYTLRLYDFFGDGWNGNNLILNNNGVNSTHTITNAQQDFAQFSIPVNFGSNLTFTFDGAGNFIGECSFDIRNCAGQIVYNGVAPLNTNPNNLIVGPFAEPVGFTWSPPSIFGQSANMPNPEVFIGQNTNVSVAIYPLGHPLCAESSSMNIFVQPDSYVGKDSIVSICQTITPENLFVYLGPGANPNGTWVDPAGAPINMPIDPATMLEGTYVYTVDNGVCEGSARVTVNKFAPQITALSTTDATCTNSFTGTATITGTSFSSYTLNGSFPQLVAPTFTINGLNEGFHTVSLYSTPSCRVDTTFFINDPDSLEITFLSAPVTICKGDTVAILADVIGGSSNYIYNWTLNGVNVGNAQTIDVGPLNNYNTYCVTVTEECGSIAVTACTNVDIEQNILPILTTPKPDVCLGEEVIFNDSTAAPNVLSTLVYFGDGDSIFYTNPFNSFTHIYDSIKSYSLSMIVISNNLCVYTNGFTNMISVHQSPTANFYINPDAITSFSPEANFVNQSSQDVISNSWYMFGAIVDTANTEDANATYPLGMIGEYPVQLKVENHYGCRDSIQKIVIVEDDLLIYIPNSFTPNGDDLNNTWKITTSGIDVYQFTLSIYNRWGELIFVSHDPEYGWDGTFGNSLVQAGLYQWRIEGVNILTNQDFERFGFINVFR